MRVLLILFATVGLLCLPAAALDRAVPVQDEDSEEVPEELDDDEPEVDDSDADDETDDSEPEPEPEPEEQE